MLGQGYGNTGSLMNDFRGCEVIVQLRGQFDHVCGNERTMTFSWKFASMYVS